MSNSLIANYRVMVDLTEGDPQQTLRLCWWFIENVGTSDEGAFARNEVFFCLRKIVREELK